MECNGNVMEWLYLVLLITFTWSDRCELILIAACRVCERRCDARRVARRFDRVSRRRKATLLSRSLDVEVASGASSVSCSHMLCKVT